jgi:hypothetical protein
MRWLFWLAMGVTIGAMVVRKLSKAAQRLTPGGMANGLAGALTELADSIQDFAADVREAMHDRELQLREATGLDGNTAQAPSE